MSSIVQNMLEKSLGDGARSTKFDVLFQFTNGKQAPESQDLMALVKTTQLPSVSHSTIDFKYKGRSIPLKGQTKFSQTWECTFYLTEDHKLKQAFENWMLALDQQHHYFAPTDAISETIGIHHTLSSYTTSIKIYQRNFDDDQNTAEYTLYNVFPTEISPISYDYSSTGQIQEFTVTFAYSYFTSGTIKGRSGNFIDELVGKFNQFSQNVVSGAMSAIGDAINGFVKDAVGDTLSELNAWSSGLSTDVNVPASFSTAKDLVSGGLSSAYQSANNIMTTVSDQIGSTLNGISDSVTGLFNDATESAKNTLSKK